MTRTPAFAAPILVLLCTLAGCGPTTVQLASAEEEGLPGPRNAALRAAASEQRVPRDVLAAWAWVAGRLEPGEPGGAGAEDHAHGHADPHRAGLMHLSPEQVKAGARATTRSEEEVARELQASASAAAALLREALNGKEPGTWDAWLEAVAQVALPGSEEAARHALVEELRAVLAEGFDAVLSDGERVRLVPLSELAAHGRLMQRLAAPGQYPQVDWYAAHPANHTSRVGSVKYIVIHDVEGSYWSAISWFQQANPPQASAHYVIRSSDGRIAQMVNESRTAWHAGNTHYSHNSIGIEHEGYAANPSHWYTEAMYQSSARLVCAIAVRHGVPVDRAHIIGHYQIPSPTQLSPSAPPGNDAQTTAYPWRYGGISNHHDPGRNGTGWNWPYYLGLVKSCVDKATGKATDATGSVPAQRVEQNADGRMEVVARGKDNALWHAWQKTPNGGWSGWASQGGYVETDPVLARNQDGRLEIFVTGTDGKVWRKYQLPQGGWLGHWINMGGGNFVGEPAVARNADGRLEVFVRRSDGSVWHNWQVTPNGGWSGGWVSMGGQLTSQLAVGRNKDGRLEVFGRGKDGALWHAWQQANLPSGWSQWYPMGGQLSSPPAVGTNKDGRLELFARGTDHALWHSWQTAQGGWSGWHSLGGALTSAPTVGQNPDGRLEVFHRGTDGAVYAKYQLAPGGNWVPGWNKLGGNIASGVATGRNADGRIQLFARGSDGQLHHKWQLPGGGWSAWAGQGGALASF